MSEQERPAPGSIGWVDLTVPDAAVVRDFYRAVVGWEVGEVDMGEYSDYMMNRPGGQATAGVCWARGANAGLPAQWLIYITVADLDQSLARCRELGGEVLAGPKGSPGKPRYAIVRDPAGAVAALYDPGPAIPGAGSTSG